MGVLSEFHKGDVLFKRGDNDDRIFYLYDGAVFLMQYDPVAKQFFKVRVKQGEYFGVASALKGESRPGGAVVAEDGTSITIYSTSEFHSGAGTKLLAAMLRFFSDELRDLHIKLNESLGKEVALSPKASDLLAMTKVAQLFFDSADYAVAKRISKRVIDSLPKDGPSAPSDEKKSVLTILYNESSMEAAGKQYNVLYKDNEDDNNENKIKISLPLLKSYEKTFLPGEPIYCEFEEGDKFFLVTSGEVELVKVANGARKSIALLRVGHFFGEMSLINKDLRFETAIAKVMTTCIELDKENFKILLNSSPKFAESLLISFCWQVGEIQKWVRVLGCEDDELRVTNALVFICDNFEDKTFVGKNGARKINATTKDIASWAALPLARANAVLNRLTSESIIDIFSTVDQERVYTHSSPCDYILIRDLLEVHRLANKVYDAEQK